MKNDSNNNVSIDRLERKWMLENVDVNNFFIAMYRSNFLFSETYKERNINTIYFDDLNFSSISKSVSTKLMSNCDDKIPPIVDFPQPAMPIKLMLFIFSKFLSCFN